MKGLSPPYLDHRNGIEASTYVRRKYFGIDFLALSRQNQAMRFPYRARRLPHVSLLVVCGLAAIGLPLLVDLGLQGFLEPIELWSVDVRFRLRATPAVLGASPAGKSQKLGIIDYDDLAAREHGLGRWPWNRRVHAGLTTLENVTMGLDQDFLTTPGTVILRAAKNLPPGAAHAAHAPAGIPRFNSRHQE